MARPLAIASGIAKSDRLKAANNPSTKNRIIGDVKFAKANSNMMVVYPRSRHQPQHIIATNHARAIPDSMSGGPLDRLPPKRLSKAYT